MFEKFKYVHTHTNTQFIHECTFPLCLLLQSRANTLYMYRAHSSQLSDIRILMQIEQFRLTIKRDGSNGGVNVRAFSFKGKSTFQ